MRLLITLFVLAFAIGGCVRHVDLRPIDAAIDAPNHPDAAIDAPTPDALPDSAIDAM
jgi:hypothetical protein